MGADSSAIYAFRSVSIYSNEFIFQKTDIKTGKVLFKRQIDLQQQPAFKGLQGNLTKAIRNNKLLLFFNATRTIGNKNTLMLQEYSCDDGIEIGAPLIIKEIDDKLMSDNSLDIKVVFSPDKEKIMVITETKGRKQEQLVMLTLYSGKNYEKVWEKKAETVFGNSTISSFNYLVDNSGNVVYNFAYVCSRDEDSYGIGMISNKNSINRLYAIPIQDKTIQKPVLQNYEEHIVCSGRYYFLDKKTEKPAFYFMTIDAGQAEVKSETFDVMTEDLIAKLTYKINVGKNSDYKEYKYFTTVYLNGAYYVVRFHNYSAERNVFEKEIIVSKYGKGNKLEWMQIIPRSTSSELTGLNYVIMDKLYFLYYDLDFNLKKSPDPKVYKPDLYLDAGEHREASLVLTAVDENGNLKRTVLDTAKEPYRLNNANPHGTYLTGTNTVIMENVPSKKTRTYSMITFTP